ncbi:hypothetical protein DFJ63DRAFT_333616 [Scheffersomyces coipomensis]|uniref:uncharacterized protein n=1 Tax=Scheffersomyces coipomensis TaxID=1788519 RepID=UPI00315D67C2
MLGSSKSLIKGLDSLFDTWKEDGVNTLDTSELLKIIAQFLDRHNTLQIIRQSTSINDELFRLYKTYIQPSSNLSKEVTFLKLLYQLSPVLNKKEIFLWLTTYLKPAVDSAGYDLKFVESSREFIRRVTINLFPTDDPELRNGRQEIASDIAKKLMELYIGTDDLVYEIIKLKPSQAEKDTQVYEERLRFIKQNCQTLIQEYGLTNTEDYLRLINSFIISPTQRLASLTLLSSLISSNTSQILQITNTDLFPNIMKCLSYDFSESVILSSLSILIMLIPQICHKIASYLSDILVIYIRIMNWEEFNKYVPKRYEVLLGYMEEANVNWTITNFDQSTDYSNFDSVTTKMEFDIVHLGTLIYGLFPLSLSKFCQSPFTYLKHNVPKFINPNYIARLDAEIKLKGPTTDRIEYTTRIKTKALYQSLLVHPKFIDFDKNTIEQELKNPIQWILDVNDGESIGTEEVAITCLSLNPDILVTLSDTLTTIPNVQSSDSPITPKLISRNSSIGSPLNSPLSTLVASSVQNIHRKMSIIPTNLVIEHQRETPDVFFKDIKFDEGKSEVEDSTLNSFDMQEEKHDEPISDLLTTHEKLFGPKTKLGPTDLARKPSILKSEVRIQRPISSPTTSVETTTVAHKGSIGSSSTGSSLNNNAAVNGGTALDYYQRELLLMKNALEFSSYMKHLNKFHYIRLKLKMNKLLREASLHYQSIEHKNNLLQIQELNESSDDMKGALSSLQLEADNSKSAADNEKSGLFTQLQELQEKNRDLKYLFEEIQNENNSLHGDLNQLNERIIPIKDLEIENLKVKLKELETNQVNNNKAAKKSTEEEEEVSTDMSEIERKLVRLRDELLVSQDKNSKIAQELSKSQDAYQAMQKSYEYKLASSKIDLNENINSFTSHYDKKIQELSTTILKYEALIEEKNSKILQLSSSKPISIPMSTGGYRIPDNRIPQRLSRTSTTADFNEGYIQEKDRSNSSLDSISPPPSNVHLGHQPTFSNYPQFKHQMQTAVGSIPPQLQNKTPSTLLGQQLQQQQLQQQSSQQQQQQQQPIIRGRGGLQKRSKKMM